MLVNTPKNLMTATMCRKKKNHDTETNRAFL